MLLLQEQEGVNPIVVVTGVEAVSVREGVDVTEGAATEEVIGIDEGSR